MQFPEELVAAITKEISQYNKGDLSRIALQLSDKYRSNTSSGGTFVSSKKDCLAYLMVRMQGTYAAAEYVIKEFQRLMPKAPLESLLDIGAGPGTIGWVASNLFDSLRKCTFLEGENNFIQIGQSIAVSTDNSLLKNAEWINEDISKSHKFKKHDLVVCSYVLNELPLETPRKIVAAAWNASDTGLIIIEPGTMAGFGLIRKLREDLIGLGAHMVAPCSHQNECPLPRNDWCHFSNRLSRTSLHHNIKDANQSYEDEKFSYLIASKSIVETVASRVIRHPLRYSGHTKMQLCSKKGLENITITRSNKAAWKRVRKTNWGDEWAID